MIEVFVTMIKAVCYMRMTKKVYLKKGVLSSQGQQSSYIFIFFSFTVCLSVWLSACLSLSLSVCLSGIGGGPGASHGPSAQYVPAGAEWRRCDSGETMEVLWLRQPRFSVTQGERTHTLRKHTEQTFKHVCVCVCTFCHHVGHTAVCRTTMSTQADTGNCGRDRRSPKTQFTS